MTPGLALPDLPPLVVLPFANLSGTAEQDYFANGITEELTTALSRNRWFFVIACGSVFTYKGRAVDVRQVGRDLGARYVLEGSVRKASDRVRISTQLIETEAAHHVWANRFEGALNDIFELQDRVTGAVAAVIEPNLRKAEIERSAKKPTESLDTYDLYLRALPQVWSNTRAGSDAAIALLDRARAIDPGLILAKATGAWLRVFRKSQGWSSPEEWEMGAALAGQVLVAAPDDPSALKLAGIAMARLGRDYGAGLAAANQTWR